MAIALYHNDMSTCAQKVRITLFEKNIPWTSHHLNLRKGDQFDPAYMKLNPNGVVPTIVDDGHVVIESNSIIEYLDEKFPVPSLRPADEATREIMRGWFKALDTQVHGMTGVLSIGIAFRHEYIAEGPEGIAKAVDTAPDENKRKVKRALLEQGIDAPFFAGAVGVVDQFLGRMEAGLSQTGWLAGDAFSLADIALMPYLARFNFLGLEALWTDRPALSDWFARVQARPSFTKVTMDDVAPKRMSDLIAHGKAEAGRLSEMIAAARKS
jgi:glutathione S-transferase